MKPLTRSDLEALANPAAPETCDWIRVQCDTGGIAAGAEEIFQELTRLAATAHPDVAIRRTGSTGYSFADPVLEVQCAHVPRILYGRMNVELAATVLKEHIAGRRLLDDHAIATRQRPCALTQPVTHLLVRDTHGETGAKTEYFQLSLQEALQRVGLADRVQVVRALDLGLYQQGVCVQLLPDGVTYANLQTADIPRLVAESVAGGGVLADRLWTQPDRQVRIVLRNCGLIDPESLEDYLRRTDGYQALRRALFSLTPEQVIAEIKTSGLRGRGGAGFPTWMKWRLTREQPADQRYVICNGDEGDPGAFMDRSVLESDPHSVLEGMLIAAYAMGASQGYFYIRAEYPQAVARIERALAQARAAGLLGQNILGSGFTFDAKIRLGAGAFVCGEETALIASIEGKRGSPSPRPPYPSVRGLWGKPTAINNVETLASVPAILLRGGAWFAGYGTDTSKGTKVFAVTGKVRNAQLVEVPMGTTLRQIVEDICGGVADGHTLKAVQTGGPSGGVVPIAHLDTPVSYETLQKLGSIMGSGGMLVMDTTDNMVEVAKFYLRFSVDESCGKCAPCRIGGYQLLQILERITRGRANADDMPTIRRICQAMQKGSLCGLGQTAPNPVLSTLRYFPDEYKAFIDGGPVYARKFNKAAPSPTTKSSDEPRRLVSPKSDVGGSPTGEGGGAPTPVPTEATP